MSFINYTAREINLKVVYYGPGLSGKTTNLQFIYERTNPDARGKMISLSTQTERTLFFDFLPLSLGQIRGFKTRFHLYTVPGQLFYDASRKLTLKGVDGVIFVADSQVERLEANEESLDNLRVNLAEQGDSLDRLPYVIQYNKRDLSNVAEVGRLRRLLNPLGVPDFEAVALSGAGVFDTLKTVSKLALNDLKRGESSASFLSSSTSPAHASDVAFDQPHAFDGFPPERIAEVFARCLNAKTRHLVAEPFSVVSIEFPRTFPLGLRNCALAIPPRELGGQEVFNSLREFSSKLASLRIVYSIDGRQMKEIEISSSAHSRMIAIIDPRSLKSILNAPVPAVEFAERVARQVDVNRISPYAETGGVDNDYVFFGRTQILEDILSRQAGNYMLVGGRRLGKTALLQAIERRSIDHHLETMYVTLTGDDLLDALSFKLGSGKELNQVVVALRAGPHRFIMIDEADLFLEADSSRGYAQLRQLRQLSVAGTCSFILAGFWQLYRSCRLEHHSPLLNFGRTIEVGALEDEACHKLVTEPLDNLGIVYDSQDTVEEFIKATGGRANLLALGCREFLKRLGNDRTITRDILQSVLQSHAMYEPLVTWQELSGASIVSPTIRLANRVDRLVILSTIAKGVCSATQVRDTLKRHGLVLTQKVLDASLLRLQLEYILVRHDFEHAQFRYAVPLFQAHLLREPVEDLLAEEAGRLKSEYRMRLNAAS